MAGGGVRLEERLYVVGCSPIHRSEGQYQGLESDTGRDVQQVQHVQQDNHVLDLSIYCYMTWTRRFNFGGVDDLREALPASSMQHIHT